MHAKFWKVVTLALVISVLSACETFDKLREPKPLEGKDVHVYSLADGQVEFRTKITGLTSTLWISTELVNKSTKNLTFSADQLLKFEDPTCLEDQEFENLETTLLAPGERQVVRYSFRLYAKQKSSAQYERCKALPLKFVVDGLLLDGMVVKPLTLTVE